MCIMDFACLLINTTIIDAAISIITTNNANNICDIISIIAIITTINANIAAINANIEDIGAIIGINVNIASINGGIIIIGGIEDANIEDIGGNVGVIANIGANNGNNDDNNSANNGNISIIGLNSININDKKHKIFNKEELISAIGGIKANIDVIIGAIDINIGDGGGAAIIITINASISAINANIDANTSINGDGIFANAIFTLIYAVIGLIPPILMPL